MANIRRGFGDDLTLKNGNLGINTTTAQEKVDVVGVVKGQDLYATGVSSLTAYEGFLRADNQIVESTTLEFGQGLKSSLSGEIIVGTGVTVTIGAVGLGTAEVGVGTHTIQNNIDTTDINLAGGSQIECLKVYNTFTPPSGGTNERPYKPKPGQLYYNYDFKTIEFFDGNGWRQVDNTTRAGRGVFGAGWDSSNNSDNLQSIQLTTLGNSVDFGTLVEARRNPGGRVSSSIRGFIAGGYTSGQVNRIDSWTFASGGQADDFGNLLSVTHAIHNNGVASSSRGIWAGGQVPSGRQNVIQYIEMGTFGDTLDFGDLNNDPNNGMGVGSPVRGLFCGGQDNPLNLSIIDGITIASKGDAVNFGDLTKKVLYGGSVSSGTRGVIAGGEVVPSPAFTATSNMEYITISSAGRGFDFGELTSARSRIAGMETSTRGVFAGSVATGSSNTFTNVIDYINIGSVGNAIDFGDITNGSNYQIVGCSDSHGGLGGF